MRHAKKSTNRDFRITFQEVPEPVEEAKEDEEAEAQAEHNSDAENQVCSCSLSVLG